jgi:hypothetical protein
VQLHGGELSLHSRVGEGTRVTVRLPIDCERARPARNTAAAHQPVGVVTYLPGYQSLHPAGAGPVQETLAPLKDVLDIRVKKSA